jgi:hypothetical protein
MLVENWKVLWQCMFLVCSSCVGVRGVVVRSKPLIYLIYKQIKPNNGSQRISLVSNKKNYSSQIVLSK